MPIPAMLYEGNDYERLRIYSRLGICGRMNTKTRGQIHTLFFFFIPLLIHWIFSRPRSHPIPSHPTHPKPHRYLHLHLHLHLHLPLTLFLSSCLITHVSATMGNAFSNAGPSVQLLRSRRWRSKTGLMLSSCPPPSLLMLSSVSHGSYFQFSDKVLVYGMNHESSEISGYNSHMRSRIRGQGKWSTHAGWGVKS